MSNSNDKQNKQNHNQILKLHGLQMDKVIDLKLNVCCSKCKHKKYFFKLDYPILVKLTNDCCNLDSSIVIPKCFEIGHTLFKIECDDHITFKYTNLDKHSKIMNVKAKNIDGYYIINLETSSDLKYNKLCIEEFVVQVQCLSEIKKCEHSAKIGELVYTEKTKKCPLSYSK